MKILRDENEETISPDDTADAKRRPDIFRCVKRKDVLRQT